MTRVPRTAGSSKRRSEGHVRGKHVRLHRASTLDDARVQETRSEGYCFLIEVLSALRQVDARIVELPITYVDRRAGSSKISRGIITEAFVLATAEGLARLAGRRPVRR